MPSIRQTFRNAAALAHRACGVLFYHCGARDRARRRFQRVLELKGDDFSAYVHLGRMAYSLGDYAGWRRESELARRASPDRFARLGHPFDLHRPRTVTNTVFEEAGDRASWRLYRVGQLGERASEPALPSLSELSSASEGHESRRASGKLARRDDFSSADERARFATLQPLRTEDIRAADLEELARRLG